jgi:hypothetical protein
MGKKGNDVGLLRFQKNEYAVPPPNFIITTYHLSRQGNGEKMDLLLLKKGGGG